MSRRNAVAPGVVVDSIVAQAQVRICDSTHIYCCGSPIQQHTFTFFSFAILIMPEVGSIPIT